MRACARAAYLLADTGEDDEEGGVEGGEEDRDDDERDVADNGRPVGEGVEGRSAVIAECVEPSLHVASIRTRCARLTAVE